MVAVDVLETSDDYDDDDDEDDDTETDENEEKTFARTVDLSSMLDAGQKNGFADDPDDDNDFEDPDARFVDHFIVEHIFVCFLVIFL